MAKSKSRKSSGLKPLQGLLLSLGGGAVLTALLLSVHYQLSQYVSTTVASCNEAFCQPHYQLWQYHGAPFPVYTRSGLSLDTVMPASGTSEAWVWASLLVNFLFLSAFLGLALWIAYRHSAAGRKKARK